MSSDTQENDSMLSFECAQLPEFEALRSHGELKDALLREVGGGEAFIARAAETIRLNLLHVQPYQRYGKDTLLDRLRRLRYGNDMISHALARAWLDGSPCFYLPRRTLAQRLDRPVFLVGATIVLALATVILMVMYGRSHYPDLTSILIWFGPLMALAGSLVGMLYYRLLRRALRYFSRA